MVDGRCIALDTVLYQERVVCKCQTCLIFHTLPGDQWNRSARIVYLYICFTCTDISARCASAADTSVHSTDPYPTSGDSTQYSDCHACRDTVRYKHFAQANGYPFDPGEYDLSQNPFWANLAMRSPPHNDSVIVGALVTWAIYTQGQLLW